MSNLFKLKGEAYAAIEERYVCIHEQRELRRRTIADGRISYVSQCIKCGHTSQPISAKKALAQSPSPPPYDDYIQQRRYAAKSAEYLQTYIQLKPALKAEYQRYLASSQWKEKRLEVMSRAQWKCAICARQATQVHHLTYLNIGNEQFDELMAICSECHELIHA